MTPTKPLPARVTERLPRITWALGEPLVLSDPEPVSIPTHNPDDKGQYGRVEYVTSRARAATLEEVETWRRGA